MSSPSSTLSIGKSKRNVLIAAAAAVVVAGIGYVLIATHAANPYAKVDPADATVVSPATLVSDASLPGGSAIQFNAAQTTPPPTGRPDPFPATLKPDATNTGVPAGQTLTDVQGDQVFDSKYNGQTISNKNFLGYVRVSGSNITFKNCFFRGGTPTGNIALLDMENEDSSGKHPGTNITVEDSTFLPTHRAAVVDGMWAENATILRVDMSGSTDTIKASNNTTIRDSYLHDLQFWSVDPNTSDGTHNDTVQILDGTNVNVIHNNLNPNNAQANSSVQITQDFGPTGIVKLDSNWADWGGYCFNITQKPLASLTGVSVTNNRFGRHGEYSYIGAIVLGGSTTLAANTNNVWDDTGTPIPAPARQSP